MQDSVISMKTYISVLYSDVMLDNEGKFENELKKIVKLAKVFTLNTINLQQTRQKYKFSAEQKRKRLCAWEIKMCNFHCLNSLLFSNL